MSSAMARALAPFLRAYLLPFDSSNVSTWTPVLYGATTAGTFTYSTQEGRYTRLGNLVIARARIVVSAVSVAPAGRLEISGLPFTAANVNGPGDVAFGRIGLFNFTAGALMLTARPQQNTTTIRVFEVFDNAATGDAPATGVQANTDFNLTCTYEVAS